MTSLGPLLGLLALLGAATEGEPNPFTQAIPGTTLSFEMVPIPGGRVDVELPPAAGTAGPGEIATVEVGPFYLGKVEVTWDLYDALVYRLDLETPAEVGPDGVTRPTTPYILTDRGFGHAGYPAISISSQGAESYCRWLSARTGRTYRLPSEAEWEWAARAGTPRATGRWWFGDEREKLKEHAWFLLSASEVTHPVGQKHPNPWGLHDVYGNVAEWCTTAEGKHVLRGGSYLDRHPDATSFARAVPVRAWNATDPQVPKSPWWLSDGPFAGFRVLCEPFPRGE
ncbi:MAG: SUMF1/EgtB/PvdO family nonheme iron enzyme [Planctomycetota bacterium]